MGHYGIGELIAVTVLAELGDAGRFSSSSEAVRYGGMDITVRQSDQPPRARPPFPPGAARVALGVVRGGAVRCPRRQSRPRLLPADGGAAGCKLRLLVGRPQAAQALLPHAARARRGGTGARMSPSVRAEPFVTEMRRGRLHHAPAATTTWPAVIDRAAATLAPSGDTRSTIMSPAPGPPGPRTEIRLGARAHTTRTTNRAHEPPPPSSSNPSIPVPRWTRGPCTDKERGNRPQ
jgi:hypothetical protein